MLTQTTHGQLLGLPKYDHRHGLTVGGTAS